MIADPMVLRDVLELREMSALKAPLVQLEELANKDRQVLAVCQASLVRQVSWA